MIHIKEQKNGLNYMGDTELLDECYFDILNVLANSESKQNTPVFLILLCYALFSDIA